jgi:hypothetical protein
MEASLPFSERKKERKRSNFSRTNQVILFLLNNSPLPGPSRRNGLFPHFSLSVSWGPEGAGRYFNSKGTVSVLKRSVLSILTVPLFFLNKVALSKKFFLCHS